MATAPKPTLRNKFRKDKDYTQEMLIRDLIEYAQEMEKIVQGLHDRLTALGG